MDFLERNLGGRYFRKEDGCLYETVFSGFNKDGKKIYRDNKLSTSNLDVRNALTLTEYKHIDSVVTEVRNNTDRFTTWLRSLTGNVVTLDGMNTLTYYYRRQTAESTSRSTLFLEDDSPSATNIELSEDGVVLPLEFGDWTSNIRMDPSASYASGIDLLAEKARATAEGVARGLDYRQINGWNGLTYKGAKVFGFRDLPYTSANTIGQLSTAANDDGWISTSTPTQIYKTICNMVRYFENHNIPGPFVLVAPSNLRYRFAETFSTNSVTSVEKSLWQKILETPASGVPNILNLSQIKFVDELNFTANGGTPTAGEAYMFSLSPQYFRVMNYLPMQDFTIDLKGTIASKHRIAEGICPLFKKNAQGFYGIVKLGATVAP